MSRRIARWTAAGAADGTGAVAVCAAHAASSSSTPTRESREPGSVTMSPFRVSAPIALLYNDGFPGRSAARLVGKPPGHLSGARVHGGRGEYPAGHRHAGRARATRGVAGVDRATSAVATAASAPRSEADSRDALSDAWGVLRRASRMHGGADLPQPPRHRSGNGRVHDHPRRHARARAPHGRERGEPRSRARRAHLSSSGAQFGESLPTDEGRPVVERALASLQLEDQDVAPEIDWEEATRRQNEIDRRV